MRALDDAARRIGWSVRPSTSLMMLEATKLVSVLEDTPAHVEPALRAILPRAIRLLHRRCARAGINPEYACKMQLSAMESNDARLGRNITPTPPPTTTLNRPSKRTPQAGDFYSSAPMRELDEDEVIDEFEVDEDGNEVDSDVS